MGAHAASAFRVKLKSGSDSTNPVKSGVTVAMPPTPDLSVVLPIYNESELIGPVLTELATLLQQHWPDAWEVLAVNDGSTDSTSGKIQEVARQHPRIRQLNLTVRTGQSGALWIGFKAARAEWIATLDADGQNDPADLPKLMDASTDADAVFGYRTARQDTWSKKMAGTIANTVRNRLLQEEIRDTGCATKIFKKQLLTPLTPWNGMHRFLGTLFLMQGAIITQRPVSHRPRTAGISKYTNWGRLIRTLRDVFGIRWLRSRYLHIAPPPTSPSTP